MKIEEEPVVVLIDTGPYCGPDPSLRYCLGDDSIQAQWLDS